MSFFKVFLGSLSIGAFAVAMTGCGKEDDSGASGDDTSTGGGTEVVAFDIEGTAIDFATQTPAAEGLCVYATDPTEALGGGDLIILSDSTVGAGGAFTLTGITTESAFGLLILVQDCANEGTVMPSATGVAAEDYAALGDGDLLGGRSAYVLSADFQAGIDQSVAAAGGSSDILSEGALLGFVFDPSGVPVSGATVDCEGCAPIYYADTESADGLFTNAKTGVNASTDALANGLWVVPGAPIASYTCDDGANTYEPLLIGSQPGIAVFVAFYAL